MYDSYKRKTGATQSPNYYAKCDVTSDVVNSFYEQPGYVECYKNADPSMPYEIIVMDGDKQDKTVGYKRLLSYPYSEVQFAIGDYVHFDYGGDASIWLLTTLDKQFTFEVKGRIFLCEHALNWNIGATPTSYPCYISDSLISFQDEQMKNVALPSGNIVAYAQNNLATDQITVNTRFVIGKNTWKVLQIKDLLSAGLIGFIMTYDAKDASDTSTTANNNTTIPWT